MEKRDFFFLYLIAIAVFLNLIAPPQYIHGIAISQQISNRLIVRTDEGRSIPVNTAYTGIETYPGDSVMVSDHYFSFVVPEYWLIENISPEK